MKKYAKIINDKTKEVQIGVGCSDEYYIEIGMSLMDVEQAYNNLWYIKGYAPKQPQPTEEELKAQVKMTRNALLVQSDYTQLPDSPFDEQIKSEYVQYRQYLRDYTQKEEWWLENPKTFDEWQKTIDL